MLLLPHLSNVVPSKCAARVSCPVGECQVLWVHLESPPSSPASPVEASKEESAVGVEYGGTVEHPVAEVADNVGTVTEHDTAKPSLEFLIVNQCGIRSPSFTFTKESLSSNSA